MINLFFAKFTIEKKGDKYMPVKDGEVTTTDVNNTTGNTTGTTGTTPAAADIPPSSDEKGGHFIYNEVEWDPNDIVINSSFTNALGLGSSAASTSFTPYGLQKPTILGMPFSYCPIDDPNDRVYRSTFEADLPLVFIKPGKPQINQKLFGTTNDTGLFTLSPGFTKFANAIAQTVSVAFNGKTGWRDSRWMSFKEDNAFYLSHLQVLSDNLRKQMGLENKGGGLSGIESHIKNTLTSPYGMAYYSTKGTDVSESSNNEYNAPDIAMEANNKQRDIREKKLMAQMGGGSLAEKASYWIAELVKQTADLPIIGSFVGALTENLDGSQLYFPDVWSNSTFDRFYNLEFKFYSPYGDAESIFNYVYFPFLTLLTMALPTQDGYYSYQQPFIVRVTSPGNFECEMGIIRSMTIERGGENLWSSEKLPREITVRLTVSDMYPNLILSPSNSHLQYNYGLASYIEAMGGLTLFQLNNLTHNVNGVADREVVVSESRRNSLLTFNASGSYKEITNQSFS